MITVNGKTVEVKHFPDGTQCLLNFDYTSVNINLAKPGYVDVVWRYENDEECMTLKYVVSHLREKWPYNKIILIMPYIPNARMDRSKDASEIFTLKYFCDFINGMDFHEVVVLDPHSNVSLALLNRVRLMSLDAILKKALSFMNTDTENYVYFPDEGSMKRYKDKVAFKGYKVIYGEKNRDWKTGEILSLEIRGDFPKNRSEIENSEVLMVDDIISYGGTMYHSAKKLKEIGFKKIFAYATHVENSVLDKEKGTFIKALEDGTVEKLITYKNSIFNKKHEKIITI